MGQRAAETTVTGAPSHRRVVRLCSSFAWRSRGDHQSGSPQLDEVPAGVDLERQDLGLLAVGQLEQVVGQRDALAAGPLVDEEAGLGGLAAAADVEGVDDVGEADGGPSGGPVTCRAW